MILKRLKLTHFKNHLSAEFEFGERINCILGKNGTGKTNLMDAIYYLSFTKSALSSLDKLSISHKKLFFTLFGEYDKFTIAIQQELGKPKQANLDGGRLEKVSELIGKVPLVMMLPDDTAMIKGGSEERRKFFDGALAQINSAYLQHLMKYKKLLKQRNSLLKNSKRGIDYKLLEVYDEQIIPLANYISNARREFTGQFLPYFQKNYGLLHQVEEQPNFQFESHVDENFAEKYRANIQKDVIMQRTLLGSHRDDVVFLLNGSPVKQFGSQGQQKTFIIALKFALYDFLKKQTNKTPLLLLDDIFDKLDDQRIQLLVALLSDDSRFGQIFVTDARIERSKMIFKDEKKVKFLTFD